MTEIPLSPGATQAAPWPAAPVERAARPVAFWQALVLGVLTVLFGLAVLAWPDVSVKLLGLLTGVWLLLSGIARILGTFLYWRGLGAQILSGIAGVLFVIAGVACLREVTKGVVVLAFVVALVWIFVGLAELVAAAQTHGRSRNWLVGLGIGALVLGLVFLLWPRPSLTVLVILAGIGALLVGLGELAFAVQLRRAS